MTEVDAFLTNCRLADGRLVDIGIAGGKIAAVGPTVFRRKYGVYPSELLRERRDVLAGWFPCRGVA